MLQIQWAIPEKKGEELLRTYFSENPLEFFIYLLPWKFQTNQFSTPGGKCAKPCYICRKIQDQKPRPLEIQHNSFLVTAENSTLYYFDGPGNSISSTPSPPPLCLFFSGIAQCKKSLYFFFIWFWLVFYPSWFCLLRTGKTCTSVTKVICRNSSWVTVCVKPVTYIQENTLGG